MPSIKLPLSSLSLGEVVKSLLNVIHNNGTAGVFTIAGLLLGLHYESVIDLLGFCPLPVVCGTNGLGKTQAANAALSLIGNSVNFYSSVKQRFIPRLCSRSSLPPVIDDVKIASILEDAAISFYNNGKDGTCLQETEPRTCPLFTVNYATLDCLNKDPRYKQLRLIDMIEIYACVRCWNAR